jgi:hypothetical protein
MVSSFILYQNKLVETLMRHAGVWDEATIVEMAATGDINPAMIEKRWIVSTIVLEAPILWRSRRLLV